MNFHGYCTHIGLQQLNNNWGNYKHRLTNSPHSDTLSLATCLTATYGNKEHVHVK